MPEILRPIVHVDYMINMLREREDYQGKIWVVWYNSKTMGSAGITSFNSVQSAREWMEQHPPGKTTDSEEYDKDILIYT
jgi:hypothetical protein